MKLLTSSSGCSIIVSTIRLGQWGYYALEPKIGTFSFGLWDAFLAEQNKYSKSKKCDVSSGVCFVWSGTVSISPVL